MIKTENLKYAYPAEEGEKQTLALRCVDLRIEKGSFVVVLGHNGSGKSTLAKTFNAVLLPAGGHVYVEGMDTLDEELLLAIRQRVGMVFQNPDNQIVANVVEEDVAFAPENLGVPSDEIRRRVADALGMICLDASADTLRYVRHPLVYLTEAADDICYEIMDIEDAHKLKLLSFDETVDLLLGYFDDAARTRIFQRIKDEGVDDENEKIVYMRACAVGHLEQACVRTFVDNEEAILNGTFEGSLVSHLPEKSRAAYRHCSEVSVRKIYQSKTVTDVELSGYKIMETLMDAFVGAAVHPETFHSKQLIRRVSSQYDIHSDNLETRIMAVADYISGMTDVYALDIYQKINGISLPIV